MVQEIWEVLGEAGVDFHLGRGEPLQHLALLGDRRAGATVARWPSPLRLPTPFSLLPALIRRIEMGSHEAANSQGGG